MIKWLVAKWHERQRSIDLQILWPLCRDKSPDLEHAKAAFACHAYHDTAWLCLGEEEINRQIDLIDRARKVVK